MEQGYFCELCGYVTKNKQSYSRHLARKKACNSPISTKKQNNLEIPTNITKIPTNDTKITNIDTIPESTAAKDRTCMLCNSVFKTIQSYRNHKSRNTCQNVKRDPCECRRCLKLFKNANARRSHMARYICDDVEHPIMTSMATSPVNTPHTINNNIDNSTDNSTTNNTTNNTTINITLNPFGKEFMDYITNDKELLTRCIKAGYPGLQNLMKQIFFNPEHPENHTVQMPNIRGNQLKIAGEDKNWEFKSADEVKYDMMYKAASPLHMHYVGEFNNKGEPNFEKIRKAITTHDSRNDKKSKSTPTDRKILRKIDRETTSTLINSRSAITEV